MRIPLRQLNRRRGFTLVEMTVYAGLVSVGLATFLAVEVGARHSATLQGALIDVDEESRRFLDAWRRDVEAATSIEVGAERLEIVRHDGHRVTYTREKRVEADAKGQTLGSDLFSRVTKLSFKRTKRELQASLSLQHAMRDKILKRDYRRVATPRAGAATIKDTP